MKTYRLVHYFDLAMDYVCRATGIVASIFVFLMTLLVTVDILGRSIIGRTTLVADEMSRYLLLAIVYLGLALTQRAGKHIEVNIFSRWLSERYRERLGQVTLIAGFLFIGWLTWMTWGPVQWNYIQHAKSLTLIRTPLWIPHLLVPLGLALFTLQLLVEVVGRFTKSGKDAKDVIK